MKRVIHSITVLVIIILILFSCKKTEVYSEIPEIGYKNFLFRDTTDLLGNRSLLGVLTFTFVDGDGDLGLDQPPDTATPGNPDYSNLFFTLFAYQNGVISEIGEDELEFPLAYRIPYLEPEGSDKSLKGEIEVEFIYVAFNFDTISYDFYITDRAGHESNVESTPFFILPDLDSLGN